MQASGTAGPAWERLRGTRWSPPGAAASDPVRRHTYVFALEQAEQLFGAAVTAGPATRPLQLFYGLSQAGRAIAAAASALTGDRWELAGHGIHCDPATLRGPLPEVQLQAGKPGGKTSFVRLSELFGSPLWPGQQPVTLAAMWDCLPGNRKSPLGDPAHPRTTPLYVDHRFVYAETHPLVSVTVAYFPPRVVSAPDGRSALAAYLSGFPDARPIDSFRRESGEPGAAPVFTVHDDGWGELLINWAHPDGHARTLSDHLAYLGSMTRPYRGAWWLFPGLDGTSQSMHPIMAWWAVLFTLSILARYQPAEWARHIDVDASPHAVPIESLLSQAISIIPELIAEAISGLAGA